MELLKYIYFLVIIKFIKDYCTLHGGNNNKNFWKSYGETLISEKNAQTVKHGIGSIMMRACFAASGADRDN